MKECGAGYSHPIMMYLCRDLYCIKIGVFTKPVLKFYLGDQSHLEGRGGVMGKSLPRGDARMQILSTAASRTRLECCDDFKDRRSRYKSNLFRMTQRDQEYTI